MAQLPLMLVTGFGPFLDAERNPSGEVARALADDPPEGLEVAWRELPVSFVGAPEALERALFELESRSPAAVLALGLHRESWFRLERRARAVLESEKPDLEGRWARDIEPLGATDLESELDLERLCAVMRAAGAASARVSEDAGGYVCERTFRATLEAGARLGVPGLFLHVPPADLVPVEEQVRVVGGLLLELAVMTRTSNS